MPEAYSEGGRERERQKEMNKELMPHCQMKGKVKRKSYRDLVILYNKGGHLQV